jgi:methylase of polypeptide subunit release factors
MPFNFDGVPYKFTVLQKVRKPGRFSLATFHLVRQVLGEMVTHRPSNQRLSVWDLGCGCGIVGILAQRLSHGNVKRVLFTDISEAALRCTLENLRHSDAAEGTELVNGDLFSASPDGETFDVIAFNPPFLLPGLADHQDVGGPSGLETALRYCRDLKANLKKGGCGILTLADYIDNGTIRKALTKSGFKAEDIDSEEQVILYPFQTDRAVPQAYEIANKAALEAKCGYKFEVCWLGRTQFLAFTIRLYLAHSTD